MSLGFINDSGFTLVIGHRSNDELICVMVGAGGKNLKIDGNTVIGTSASNNLAITCGTYSKGLIISYGMPSIRYE